MGSPIDHSLGRVAQSAEHTPEKRGVTGSTPVPATQMEGPLQSGPRLEVVGLLDLLEELADL
ncbi:MAG: hypothetical protein JWN99_2150, partial [Ilumatobacteraceae bacterium]|nr:hypothetical protein [Ilumatobacteraceae bacterium]